MNEDRLRRILSRMLDENEFLSPYRIRTFVEWCGCSAGLPVLPLLLPGVFDDAADAAPGAGLNHVKILV